MLQGVDTSTHQGSVNERTMREHGVNFRYLKLSEGGDFVDPMGQGGGTADKMDRLRRQVGLIRAMGMIPGGYHYLRARDDRTGAEEIEFALHVERFVGLGRGGDLRLAIDIEDGDDLRRLGVARTRAYLISAIKRYISLKGHAPVLYSFPSYVFQLMAGASLADEAIIKSCPLWIANFDVPAPRIPAPFTQSAIWQKTSKASIGGESPVDFNVADERRFVRALVPKASPTPPPQDPENTDDQAVRRAQVNCNRFTNKWLTDVAPLIVDGIKGPATSRRIMGVKWYLGYGKSRDAKVTPEFVRRLRHPRDPKFSKPSMIATGILRRRRQKRRARKDKEIAGFPGATLFDGKPVPTWTIVDLRKIRARGRWKGVVTSGIRTPERSVEICHEICGHDTCSCCPACAGRGSNHNATPPVTECEGALDVSDFFTFEQELRAIGSKLKNDLPNDRLHFSCTGH